MEPALMFSSIKTSASHASPPPPPLGLTARRLPNEAIFPPNPNKLQPLIPSRDEAATSQPEARSLRRFSLRPMPLGATHSCAAFPTTANHVERLTKRTYFSFQPEQTETTCIIPSRSHFPRRQFSPPATSTRARMLRPAHWNRREKRPRMSVFQPVRTPAGKPSPEGTQARDGCATSRFPPRTSYGKDNRAGRAAARRPDPDRDAR